MEKNLAVPFKSQWDPEGSSSNNDCGSTCLSMVLAFNNIPSTINEITDKTGAGRNFITLQQLLSVAQSYGLQGEIHNNQTFDQLKHYLDQGIPVIVVVHNGDLLSRQDQGFPGGHIIVVRGYRDDNSVYANDPDFSGALRGDGNGHVYTFTEFSNAWRDSYMDGNLECSLLVVYPKAAPVVLDTLIKAGTATVTSSVGVRTRTSPQVNAKNIKGNGLLFNTSIDVVDVVLGDTPQGTTNNVWYKTKDGLFIWSGGCSAIVAPVAPPPPPVDKDALIASLQKENDQLKADNAKLQADLNTELGVVSTNQTNVSVVADKVGGLMDSLLSALHIKK